MSINPGSGKSCLPGARTASRCQRRREPGGPARPLAVSSEAAHTVALCTCLSGATRLGQSLLLDSLGRVFLDTRGRPFPRTLSFQINNSLPFPIFLFPTTSLSPDTKTVAESQAQEFGVEETTVFRGSPRFQRKESDGPWASSQGIRVCWVIKDPPRGQG